jgi:preprotein translocase subunit SecD
MNAAARSLLGSSFVLWLAAGCAAFLYLFTLDKSGIHLRQDRIKFGIDLVGGSFITLGVQTDKAIEAEVADKMQFFVRRLEKENLPLPRSQNVEGIQARMVFDSIDDARTAERYMHEHDNALDIKSDGAQLTISLKEAAARRVRDWAVEGNINVLRTRLDSLGVGEIPIAAQGENRIVVELPDVDDPQKAKQIIGKPALLEIKLVERMGASPEEILDEYDGEMPDGMTIIAGKEQGYGKAYYLVPAYTDLTGRLLKDAYVGFANSPGAGSEVVVHFVFTPEGGEKFHELTKANINRQVAVIIDGLVISAPRVSTPIGAEGYIHGNFTSESATELAMLLKSGAFVAPVTFEEERQIGPTLGQESIRQGLLACLVGLILLCIFSVAIYKVAGIFAIFALVFNLLLILVALGWLQATLTLPGIAGMVLTIGMAIDASILIYEKIREELRNGIPLRNAVQSGFSDAMEVILDSNITTFIVGIILYRFGAGPIQGFALTMMIGIIATLLTGLFFLRSIFTFILQNLGVQKIKI